MPQFLEDRLRAEAAKHGFTGKRADKYVYGAMNNLGVMRGNQETAKGRRMTAKHTRDVKAGKASAVPHPHRNLGTFLHKAKVR